MDQKTILSSIVRIHAYGRPSDFAQPYRSSDRSKGVGTGMFVEGSSPTTLYVLTCAHVVDSADSIAVLLPLRSQSEVAATVISFVPEYDLALIAIPDEDGSIRAVTRSLPIGSSHSLKLGEKLTAYGFPLGQTGLKVSDGVYAGFQHLLQHTVSISPGNSGGPLTDEKSRIVGVNNSGIVSPEASNIGYAVPIEFFMSERARMFSVPPGAPSPARVLHLPSFGFYFHEATESQVAFTTGGEKPCCSTGVFVYKVLPNSPAADAGMQRGDILCKFEGSDVENTGEISVTWNYQRVPLEHVLRRAVQADNEYSMTFWSTSTGACETAAVRPRVLSQHGMRQMYPPYDPVDYVAFMGFTIMELCQNHLQIPSVVRAYLRLEPEDLQSPHLVVTHLFNGMKAQTSGSISAGDLIVSVNGVEVNTLASLRDALRLPQTGSVPVLVVQTDRGVTFTLSVDEALEQEDRANAGGVASVYRPEQGVIDALRQQYAQPQNLIAEEKEDASGGATVNRG